MRNAWEEAAAVICTLWTLCAVPVVVVDTVAMPGNICLVGELCECGQGSIPVKDVEAVDCHRVWLAAASVWHAFT
jgi:hypothetical protein